MGLKLQLALVSICLFINTCYIIYFYKKFEQNDKDIKFIVDFINKEIKGKK